MVLLACVVWCVWCMAVLVWCGVLGCWGRVQAGGVCCHTKSANPKVGVDRMGTGLGVMRVCGQVVAIHAARSDVCGCEAGVA